MEERNMESRTYTVPNISCGHCVHTIQTELRDLKGITQVEVNQAEKRVAVDFELPATDEVIRTTLAEIDYPVAG
jgi:copper chaperone CopZ